MIWAHQEPGLCGGGGGGCENYVGVTIGEVSLFFLLLIYSPVLRISFVAVSIPFGSLDVMCLIIH